jgi:hypothetical protein
MTNLVLEEARGWWDKGVAPIPCHPGSKVACVPWAVWQNTLPPIRLVEVWFQEPVNLGLLCGGPMGLVVLDFDRLEVYEQWAAEHTEHARSFTVGTPRPGRHVYYFCGTPVNTKIHLQEGIDLKAIGGYVVSPPSRTEKGAYEVLRSGDILHIDSLAVVLLDNLGAGAVKNFIPSVNAQDTLGIKKICIAPVATAATVDTVSRIKAALPLLVCAGWYTKPVPSSQDGRWYIAPCIFHSPDRHPSMWIDVQRGRFGCFVSSCRAHRSGDVINLYAMANNLPIAEAISRLANLVL